MIRVPEDVWRQPVVAHDLWYGGAPLRLQGQQADQQLARARAVLGGQGRGHAAHDLQDERGKGRRLERALERRHLIEDAADGPHIRLGVVRLA